MFLEEPNFKGELSYLMTFCNKYIYLSVLLLHLVDNSFNLGGCLSAAKCVNQTLFLSSVFKK